jgi:8-oxo-dGTP diphosphatase
MSSEGVWFTGTGRGACRAALALPTSRASLAALEDRARSAGFESVRLDCPAQHSRVVGLYQQAGYYPVTAAPVRSGELSLEKNLVAAAQLEQVFDDWRPDLTGTLLFVVDGDRVLLIDKKTGHGAGMINAPGGKLEAGETAAACAVRETREEVGIEVMDPRLMARLKFADTVASQWFGYVYVAHRYSGIAVETREAVPHWYALGTIPYERMWQDDRIWLPRVLAGDQVEGEFLFDDGRLRAHRLVGAEQNWS